MKNQPPKIFLSYARENRGIATRLYNDLNRYELDVWLDMESLLPGDRWKDRIQDAIENSSYFIALLSTRSVNKKGFVQKELKTALEVLDLFPSSERFILPLRLDDCEICERKLKEHHWVDLFGENEYENGFKKILMVVSPGRFIIRNKPKELSSANVNEMLKIHGYYDRDRNPDGKGIDHQYELQKINNDNVIFDKETALMWQQSGSEEFMDYKNAKKYINELNNKQFAGFNDWRLSTLEEAMSLMEFEEQKDRYIDPIFNREQCLIWTMDQVKNLARQWAVHFDEGYCAPDELLEMIYVRAVRSGRY